jgi:hypothetical protein
MGLLPLPMFCFLYIIDSSFLIGLVCTSIASLCILNTRFFCLNMNQYQSSEHVVYSSLMVDPFLHDTFSAVCTMWLGYRQLSPAMLEIELCRVSLL